MLAFPIEHITIAHMIDEKYNWYRIYFSKSHSPPRERLTCFRLNEKCVYVFLYDCVYVWVFLWKCARNPIAKCWILGQIVLNVYRIYQVSYKLTAENAVSSLAWHTFPYTFDVHRVHLAVSIIFIFFFLENIRKCSVRWNRTKSLFCCLWISDWVKWGENEKQISSYKNDNNNFIDRTKNANQNELQIAYDGEQATDNLPLSHSSDIDISDIFVWVMSLCDAKKSTTSRFSFLIGTISKRHQNGVPENRCGNNERRKKKQQWENVHSILPRGIIEYHSWIVKCTDIFKRCHMNGADKYMPNKRALFCHTEITKIFEKIPKSKSHRQCFVSLDWCRIMSTSSRPLRHYIFNVLWINNGKRPKKPEEGQARAHTHSNVRWRMVPLFCRWIILLRLLRD